MYWLQRTERFKFIFDFHFTYRRAYLFIDAKLLSCKQKISEAENLSENNIIAQYFDRSSKCRHMQNGYTYINNLKDADSIAFHLCENWNGYILEANPGPGLVSKAILETGVSHLRVFEKNVDLFPTLEILTNTYPNFEIIKEDLMFLPSFDARISYDESVECEKFFQGIPDYSCSEGVPFRFFSIISSKKNLKFLRYLLTSLPAQTSLFSFGQCELFLMLSKSEYEYMTAEPKENFATYRWSTILYNLFFEIKCLKKFNSESFFPSPMPRNKKKMCNHFYLVKLTPKPDLHELVGNRNKLFELYFFVRNHFGKRTAFVIPTMEKWIPFCGPRLIKEGMNVFTKFGDLNPKQVLMLFNQFSSWPEYEDSSFCTAFERYQRKCLHK